MSNRKTRSELAKNREPGALVSWARGLMDERRDINGGSLSLPEPPAKTFMFEDDQKRYFLELYAATDSITASCMIAGWSTSTVSKWRNADPELQRAMDLVTTCGKIFKRERTRTALEKRGIDGYNRKPMLDGAGNIVYDPVTDEPIWLTSYSDAALNKLTDLDFPEIKRDTPLVEINTSGVIRMPSLPEGQTFDEAFGDAKAPDTIDVTPIVKDEDDA